MGFSVKELQMDTSIHYNLIGYVNEESELPPIKSAPVIRINLIGVTGLNSVGTRKWCNWVELVSPPNSILVENCPPLFVKSFNQVIGAVTPNMQIVSFYVPFVSVVDGERTDLLLTREDITPTGDLVKTDYKNEKGEDLELDVLPDYFKFLRI